MHRNSQEQYKHNCYRENIKFGKTALQAVAEYHTNHRQWSLWNR